MTTENITIREEVRQDDRIRTISNISNRDDVRIATYVCINETIRPHSEVRKGTEVSTQRRRRQRKTYYGSNSRLHKLRVINPGLFGAPQPKEVKMDETRNNVLRLYDVYHGGFTDTDRKTKHRDAMREQVKCMKSSELLGHLLHATEVSLNEIIER